MKFFLFFLILVMSCNPEKDSKYNYYKKGLYFIEHTDVFEKKNNLYLGYYGINLNSTSKTPTWHEIHQFEVTFYCFKEMVLKDVRMKLLNCVQEYLELINQNNDLKQYLYKYPFTKDELFFRISFYNNVGKDILKKDFVSSCYLDGNIIRYFIFGEDGVIEYIHKETYQEALKIIKEISD